MPSLLPATERQAVWRRLGICVLIGSALCACEPAEQTPPAHRHATPSLPDIARAQPVALTLEQVSEAFALGSPATALQRETMRAQLAGAVVRWQIRVYDIESAAGGRFRVVSEPQLGGRGPGLSLLHVQALVTPRGEADRRLLAAARTGDTLLIQGQIQDIVLRTAVVIDPAIVVPPASATHP